MIEASHSLSEALEKERFLSHCGNRGGERGLTA